jgi:pimeloyl-ACP methyl ester carboxylesterase
MLGKWCGGFSVVVLAVIVSALSGCTLLNLRKETKLLEQVSEISGTVDGLAVEGKPVVVVLLAVDPAHADRADAVIARTILRHAGDFKFFAGPGTYRVSAFVDLNESASYQTSEPVGWHEQPKILTVASGEKVVGLTITLRPPEQVQRLYPEVHDPAVTDIRDRSDRFKVGQITLLESPAFTPENGAMAFWEPIRFLGLETAGLYFLEEFDPGKTPVLFVHGAGGQPGEWKSLIEGLDRRRFQPWVAFYPSGLRLDINRQWLSNSLVKMQLQHGFDKIHLVAHSMGGLVAGGMIGRLQASGHGELVATFTTLATPWGGHELAASGVDNSPAVVPAWYDMVPGCKYQQELFAVPWSSRLSYHLFFSHRGGFNVMSGGNTDGVVSLASQLIPAAQDRAATLRGFDEDHTSILRSVSVGEHLSRVLAGPQRYEQQRPSGALAAHPPKK